MSTIDLTQSSLDAAEQALGPLASQPVQMLNLLRYRPEAVYQGASDQDECSGREAYFQRYLPAFNEVAAGEGVEVVWVGNVHGALVVPDGEAWHDIALVSYTSFASFRRIVESSKYAELADPHRQAALQDWRLLVATKMEMPQ